LCATNNYAAQFNKFGHVFQLYTQALPEYRASVDDIRNLKVRAKNGTMTPIGTVVDVKEVQGPLLISLYNLYPSATVVGSAGPGFRLASIRCRPERDTNGRRCPMRRRL
jgi:hydrophobic/amphiphilic exporter-1 (mainly G- bacteria), HAE1 family